MRRWLTNRFDAIACRLLVWGTVPALVLVLGDKQTDGLLVKFAWVLNLILTFLQWRAWGEESKQKIDTTNKDLSASSIERRNHATDRAPFSLPLTRAQVLLVVAGAYVVPTLVGCIFAYVFTESLWAVILGWLRYGHWLLWACWATAFAGWFIHALPDIWNNRHHFAETTSRSNVEPYHRVVAFLTVSGIGLAGYCVLAYWASFVSPFSRTSWKMFAYELAPVATLYFFAIRLLPFGLREPKLRPEVDRVTLALCGIFFLSVAAMTVVGLFGQLGLVPRSLLGSEGWIRVEPHDPNAPWHLQFPFSHHNRASYFATCTAFLLLAAAIAQSRFAVWWAGGSVLSLVTLVFGLTRGAILGFAAALVVLTLGGFEKRRRAIISFVAPLLLVALGIWFFLPASQREHLVRMVDVQTYQPGIQSSAGARFLIQSATFTAIAKRPFWGWGYGYEVFERVADTEFAGLKATTDGMSHTHNMWIEIAFETGLPSALLVFIFMIGRLRALALALRHPRAEFPIFPLVLFALEIAVLTYGLTNYALRRNLAFFTYALWAFVHARTIIAAKAEDTTSMRDASEYDPKEPAYLTHSLKHDAP